MNFCHHKPIHYFLKSPVQVAIELNIRASDAIIFKENTGSWRVSII